MDWLSITAIGLSVAAIAFCIFEVRYVSQRHAELQGSNDALHKRQADWEGLCRKYATFVRKKFNSTDEQAPNIPWLRSQEGELERLIAMVPEEHVITRGSLQSRLAVVREEMGEQARDLRRWRDIESTDPAFEPDPETAEALAVSDDDQATEVNDVQAVEAWDEAKRGEVA